MKFMNQKFYLVVIKGKPHAPAAVDVYPVVGKREALADRESLRAAGHRAEVREFGEVID